MTFTQKEILEVKSVPRAEFLLPGILGSLLNAFIHLDNSSLCSFSILSKLSESYDAEPDCAPSGSISGFTFINFVM